MTIQTIVISGAGGALGTAAVQILLGRGHQVFATDIDMASLTATAKRLCWDTKRLNLRELDVTSAEAWETLMVEITAKGGLDLAIQCAGYIQGAPFWEQSATEATRHLEVNALGVYLGTASAARVMVAQRRGHIMNVASMAGLMPSPGFAYYAGSKYAVRGFSLAAADELAEHGVAVTVVCPATIDTPMYSAQRDYYAKLQGRLASPPMAMDDVVAAMLHSDVLEGRPREVHIPALKGAVARGADLFPTAFSQLRRRLRGRSGSEDESP